MCYILVVPLVLREEPLPSLVEWLMRPFCRDRGYIGPRRDEEQHEIPARNRSQYQYEHRTMRHEKAQRLLPLPAHNVCAGRFSASGMTAGTYGNHRSVHIEIKRQY